MPQIQYPAYTQAFAFTPPTTDALGWRQYVPNNPRQLQAKIDDRGYRTAIYSPTLAYDFNPENWNVVDKTDITALPDNPRQLQARIEDRGYKTALYSPPFAYDFDPENWNVVDKADIAILPDDPLLGRRRVSFHTYPYLFKGEAPEQFNVVDKTNVDTIPDDPMLGRRRSLLVADIPSSFRTDVVTAQLADFGWVPELPDDPRLGRRLQLPISAEFEADFGVETAVPVMSWTGSWPDTTSRKALGTNEHPFLFRPDGVIATPAPVGWGAETPDDPRLGRRTFLDPGRYVSVFRGEAIEQFAPTLLWSALYPDTTSRSALKVGEIPSSFRTDVVAPPVPWVGLASYPDKTTRLALLTTEQLAYATGSSPEQWAIPDLSWLGHAPSKVPTLRPQTRIDWFTFALQALTVPAPPLSWDGSYPDMTARSFLDVSAMPYLFKGEALEQFAPKLLWSGWAPSTTRRRALPTSDIPTLFQVQALEAFRRTLMASATYPDATRRRALITADIPTFSYGNFVFVLALETAVYRRESGVDVFPVFLAGVDALLTLLAGTDIAPGNLAGNDTQPSNTAGSDTRPILLGGVDNV